MHTEHKIFLVLAKGSRSWHGSKLLRVTRRMPKLAAHEVAVPIEVSVPDALFKPLSATVIQVDGTNLIRPEVKVRGK